MIDINNNNGTSIFTLNQPGTSVNLITRELMVAFEDAIDQAFADDSVKSILITSAKRDFMVGADLRMIMDLNSPEEIHALATRLNAVFRKLETGGKPVACILNGSALGGGLELALACHYRVAVNNPKLQLGLVEVQVGLMPGGGGTQRLPRLIGIIPSMQPLLEGRKYNPTKALEMGMIHEVADTYEDAMSKAQAWLASNPEPLQPWDRDKYRIPGGDVRHMRNVETMAGTAGVLLQKTFHNYPSPTAIMNAVYEGLQLPFDRGIEVEVSYFTHCASSPEATNMIRSLFVNMVAAKSGAGRPKDIPRQDINKVGILGAGMMGAGIAYESARAGIEVILKDVSAEGAEKGKDYTRNLLAKGVSKGKLSLEQSEQILDRIKTTADPKDLEGCDLVVEAVFENRELKAKVTKESESVLAPEAIFASNTSTLPISGLAEASVRPEQFIGLHFFSPVDRMQLVEVIMGKQTNAFALAKSLDFVMKIRKVPIVVNDSRGFFTSRIFKTYVMEGLEMLNEGIKPALIENAAKLAGMPVGPLAVADEVSIELLYKIIKQNELDGHPEKGARKAIVNKFIEVLQRPGKKAGKGFYEYPEGEKKFLWPGLAEHYPVAETQPHVDEVKKRLLHSQAIESVRCMEEGVFSEAPTGDIGSILGWGFPPYTGGVISYVDYIGIAKFVTECSDFATRFGDRFAPTKNLEKMAIEGKTFYTNSKKEPIT